MNRFAGSLVVVLVVIIALAAAFGRVHHPAAAAAVATAAAATGSTQTIEGLVRDIACPIQNHAATATTFNMQCAVQCARRGSPLAILTSAGDLYLPISSSMPDMDQHAKLLPYIGKYVRATGQVFERNGTRAIIIHKMAVLGNVHLTTNAQ